MKKAIFWFGAIILGLSTITFFPSITHAATLTVPGDYPTIAAALAAANDNDTILVSAGTYNEALTIPDKDNLSLIGAGASTTILANNLAPITNTNTTLNLRIEGFTIGSATQNGYSCINLSGASTGVITNNIFTGSQAAGAAGVGAIGECGYDIYNNTFTLNTNGIFMLGSTLANSIHGNTFTSNSYSGVFMGLSTSINNAVYSNTFSGNAFAAHLDQSVISVYNNVMYNNGSQATDNPGAGISTAGSTIQIYANKIYQNTSPIQGGGIALTQSGANSNIFNNYISQNEATNGGGGGIYSLIDSTPIFNNTIVNNTATGGGPSNFGLPEQQEQMITSIDYPLQEKVKATLPQVEDYWNNANITAGAGDRGGGAWVGHGQAPMPSFYNNIVWGNTDDISSLDRDLVVNYCDVQEPWTGAGTGNKSSDPILTGYVLGEGSPCIDAATSAGAPSNDIDGTARPQRNGYDIGAYELRAVLPESGGQSNSQILILTLITALSAALIFMATKKLLN